MLKKTKTIVIMLYIRSLDFFILYHCNFMPFDQHLPIFPPSPPQFYSLFLHLQGDFAFGNNMNEPRGH